jgi:hypothetical protein
LGVFFLPSRLVSRTGRLATWTVAGALVRLDDGDMFNPRPLSRLALPVALALALGAPTSAHTQDRPRILYDRAHGENPPVPGMTALSQRLGIDLVEGTSPITSAALAGVRVLYLRAPSTALAPEERAAIVAFVRAGGSLLLVMDENTRQDIAVVGANDLIEPFGLRLTGDTPYLHNTGALAKAGAIHKADREVPYSGGRAVEGGDAFAFQLDKDGKPAQPFAASKALPNGARIVVRAEGMASLFLGVPEGQRLTGPPRDARNTVYWGKDSAIFMEEVLAWLIRR